MERTQLSLMLKGAILIFKYTVYGIFQLANAHMKFITFSNKNAYPKHCFIPSTK